MERDLTTLSVAQLATLIRQEWKNVSVHAQPYLSAMLSLQTVNDKFGLDSGKDVILYFLANASTFRGENAKALKAELKRRIA